MISEFRPQPTLSTPAPVAVRTILTRALHDTADVIPRLGDADDDEAVHDFRVAVRRLRTFLRGFAASVPVDDSLQRQLGDLTDATNSTRDAEAHREWLRARLEDSALAARERDSVMVALARLGSDGRPADLQEQARIVLDRVARAVDAEARAAARASGGSTRGEAFIRAAARVLDHEAARFRRRLDRLETRSDARRMHRARIAGRRLRYVLELIQGRVRGVEAPLRRLKDLQDQLGELNDLAGLRQRITDEDRDLAALIERRRQELFDAFEVGWLGASGDEFFEILGRLTHVLRESEP